MEQIILAGTEKFDYNSSIVNYLGKMPKMLKCQYQPWVSKVSLPYCICLFSIVLNQHSRNPKLGSGTFLPVRTFGMGLSIDAPPGSSGQWPATFQSHRLDQSGLGLKWASAPNELLSLLLFPGALLQCEQSHLVLESCGRFPLLQTGFSHRPHIANPCSRQDVS